MGTGRCLAKDQPERASHLRVPDIERGSVDISAGYGTAVAPEAFSANATFQQFSQVMGVVGGSAHTAVIRLITNEHGGAAFGAHCGGRGAVSKMWVPDAATTGPLSRVHARRVPGQLLAAATARLRTGWELRVVIDRGVDQA